MKAKPLLIDDKLQQQLNEDGFVSVPFLNEEELKAVKDFQISIHPNEKVPGKIDGIHMTTWCSDLEYKKKVASTLDEIYHNACERLFKDFRTLNNVFIIKEPGGGTTFKVHQDWNVVDEKENFAINVWVPLHDVDEKSGALWVLKGSHKINRHVRGSAYLFPDYSPHFDELEEAAESVNLKAGHAIIFYLNMIHGSPPNLADHNRIATCFSVIPKEAPLHIYFQKQAGDPLEVHSPEDDFMYHYEHLRTETFERAPTEKPVKVLPSHTNHPVDRKELKKFLKADEKSWLKRLFSN